MKAKVAQVDLDSVYRVKAKGHTYVYAWRGKGAPRLYEPEGSDAFIQELADALATRRTGDKSKIKALCIMWRASDAWQKPREEGGLADSTKKNWRRFLSDIQDKLGDLSIASMARTLPARKVIKKWLSGYSAYPRQRDMAKQVLSALLSYAVEEDKLESNPCIGIANVYHNDRSDRIWTPEDLAKLAAKASAHVMLAARLAALTGLRASDLLAMNWSHVGPLAIELKTGKSGRRKTTLIPIYAELRALLDTIPKRSTRVLVNGDGVPWASGFTSSWNKALIAAGFKEIDKETGKVIRDSDLHFHDLRGTAATRMYLGGLTIREIAEVMTWDEDSVERLINRYVKRDELLRDRIRRLDQNATGTVSAKLSAKPSKPKGAK